MAKETRSQEPWLRVSILPPTSIQPVVWPGGTLMKVVVAFMLVWQP